MVSIRPSKKDKSEEECAVRRRPGRLSGLVLAALVAFAACSDDGTKATAIDDADQPVDTGSDGVGDVAAADTATDADDGPLGLALGEPCDNDAVCASSLCLPGLTGRVCVASCDQSCAAGTACHTLPAALGGGNACLPVDALVCQPCGSNADCRIGDQPGFCLDYGDHGRFCGTACDDDQACPAGFSCDRDVDGLSAAVCLADVPDQGSPCACNVLGGALNADTECWVTNAFGRCTGQRNCRPEGLSECTAAVPEAEVCNGRDDDCDGVIDEELGAETCQLGNQFGVCTGKAACEDGERVCSAAVPAEEICDGADNDCDGDVDEGFGDLDEDGTVDCLDDDMDGDGWVNDMDCQPRNAEAHPDATERCNGVDDDCDGPEDEADTDCGDASACVSQDDGSWACACDPGFVHDGTACVDEDECTTGVHDCDVNAVCTNVVGGFTCACVAGFSGSGQVCVDDDECAGEGGGNDCDANATCTNVPGSYDCACVSGYTGDGVACADDDECAGEGAGHQCNVNADCNNTDGAYACVCHTGYAGDGFDCADVDECAGEGGGHACDSNAECANTVGAYTCTCHDGFTGDGFVCDAVVTCASGLCEQLCEDTDHGAECACSDGYTLNADGTSCDDVDECLVNNGDCVGTCMNAEGTYACGCTAGYTLASDGRGCTPCAAGTYDHDGDDTTACTPCAAGTVQPAAGQAACTPCAVGTFDNGSETCAACAVGSVQPTAGQTSCTPCAAGTYDDGSETCAACASGWVQPSAGQTACTPCGIGTYDNGSETCATCASGSVQPSAGQASCTPCAAGTYDDGSETCATCATGWVQATPGQTSCTQCAAGTYDDGSETCAACASGWVQPNAGQTSCTQCGVGTYDNGSETCATCASGSVQPSAGQTSCMQCGPGTHDDGSETCAQCDPGFAQSSSGTLQCEPCDAGSVQPTAGSASCNLCPKGTYDSGTGETCTACEVGTWQDQLGSQDCNDCTTCGDGQTEQMACTATSDTVCGVDGCAVDSGVGTDSYFTEGNNDWPDCLDDCPRMASGLYEINLATSTDVGAHGKIDGDDHTYTFSGGDGIGPDVDVIQIRAPARQMLEFIVSRDSVDSLADPLIYISDGNAIRVFNQDVDGSTTCARVEIGFPYVAEAAVPAIWLAIEDSVNAAAWTSAGYVGTTVGGDDYGYTVRINTSAFAPDELGTLTAGQTLNVTGHELTQAGQTRYYRFMAPGTSTAPTVDLTRTGGGAEFSPVLAGFQTTVGQLVWHKVRYDAGDGTVHLPADAFKPCGICSADAAEFIFAVQEFDGKSGPGAFTYDLTVTISP